jgi:hypothetical protein
MTNQITIVLALTFVINLITTLSYSVRIVGIRTGRIAISFALFNILVLISRTANGFQAPLLAKTIEMDINQGLLENVMPFRYIILACTVATLVGAFLIPTFQRVLSKAVLQFSVHKSVPKLLFHGFSKAGILHFKESLAIPARANLSQLQLDRQFPWGIFLMNVVAVTIVTIGVLSAVYAGYITPEYRTTASSLSAFINGLATILMFTFIDPHLSAMTDDVVMGKCSENTFRKYVIYMVAARLLGTLLAQALFLPCAELLAQIAKMM